MKGHRVNQLVEPDLMMYIHKTFAQKKPLHATYLFKLFSLSTLSIALLQKLVGLEKTKLIKILNIFLLLATLQIFIVFWEEKDFYF